MERAKLIKILFPLITILSCLYLPENVIGQDAEIEVNQAIEYYDAGDYEKALPLFEKHQDLIFEVNAADPDNLLLFLDVMIACYENTGKYSETSFYRYEKAKILQQRKDVDSIWDLINIYDDLNEYELVIAYSDTLYHLAIAENNQTYVAIATTMNAWGHYHLEDYDTAIDKFNQALDLGKQTENNVIITFSINQLINAYQDLGKQDMIIDLYAQLIAIYEEEQNIDELVDTYEALIVIHDDQKDYVSSNLYLRKILDIAIEKKDLPEIAQLEKRIGYNYWNQLDFQAAKEHLLDALEFFRQLNNTEQIAYTLIDIGSIYFFSEYDFETSQKYIDEGITLIIDEPDYRGTLAFAYNKKADLYFTIGDYIRYQEYNQKALKIYQELGWKSEEGKQLLKMGDDDDFDEKLFYYKQALALGEEIDDAALIYQAKAAIAKLYLLQSDYGEASQLYEECLAYYQSIEDLGNLAWIYLEVSNLYINRGEYKQAKAYILKSDSLYSMMNLENSKINIYQTLGRLYFYQGDYEASYGEFIKSFEIRDSLGMRDGAFDIAAVNLGHICYDLKRYEEAERYAQIALENTIRKKAMHEEASANRLLGHIRVAQQEYEQALDYYKKSGEYYSKNKQREALLQVLLGECRAYYQQKNTKKTINKANDIIQISAEIGDEFWSWEAYYYLGLIEKQNENLMRGKEYLGEAIELIEKIRSRIGGGEEAQKTFSRGEKKIQVYEAIVEVLIQMGEIEEALSYIERNNQGDLRKKFKDLKVEFEDDETNEIIEREKALKLESEAIEKKISLEKQKPAEKQDIQKLEELIQIQTKSNAEYLEFVNQSINKDPKLSKYFHHTVKPIDLRTKRKRIPQDMAVVSYLLGEEQIYIFVANTDSVSAKIVSFPKTDLDKIITFIQNACVSKKDYIKQGLDTTNTQFKKESPFLPNTQTRAFLKIAEQGYQYLIAPIAEELSNKQKIVIIPSGSLYFLPFHLLGKTLEDGSFSPLIEQFELFYTNSLEMLYNIESLDAEEFNILAFANPDKSLPNTEEEVKSIQKIYKNCEAYVGDDATEDKAKALDARFNVLHFATHGYLDYIDFPQSFLIMAPNEAKGEDGRLTLSELWGQDLMDFLDLVVLSACKTATIDPSSESAPVSPASGFLQNGVKSVIATLWKVDDEATSILMEFFYQNIQTMSKIEALRQAQITLSQDPKYHHPYYWAPFVLIGDWK